MYWSNVIAALKTAFFFTVTLLLSAPAVFAATADNFPGASLLLDKQNELAVMGLGGFIGSFTSAFLFPKVGAKDRIVAALCSTISAICVGGIFAAALIASGVGEVFAYLGAGFLGGVADPVLFRSITQKLKEKLL